MSRLHLQALHALKNHNKFFLKRLLVTLCEQLKIRTHNQLICSLFLYFQYTFHLASQYINVKHITAVSKNLQHETLPSLDQNTAMPISLLRCNYFYKLYLLMPQNTVCY